MGKLAEQIVKSINKTTNDYDAVEEADKIIKLFLDEGKTPLEIEEILDKYWRKTSKNPNV
jgi:phosphoenolpyruvate synthase/pyruvate phosphate dikinase